MPSRHVALAVAVAVVWGLNFVVIDVGLQSFPPLLFAALRFSLVAFPAILFVRRPDVAWRWVAAVGALLLAGQFGMLFVAMNIGMPAGLASLVIQLQAAFTGLLAVVLLGESLGRVQLSGALLAFAGIAVIATGRASHVPFAAVALTVGAAASWALGNICVRRAGARNAASLLVWSSLVPPVPLAILSLGLEGQGEWSIAFGSLGVAGVAALLYVVLVSTAFGFGAWTWLINRHPASRVAPFTLLVPVVGIVAAWLALGERPSWSELTGAGTVLAGLGLTMRASRTAAVGPTHHQVEEGALATP